MEKLDSKDIAEQAKKIRALSNAKLVYSFRAVKLAKRSVDNGGGSGSIERFIEELARGECKGVAGGTVYKIACFAKERGYIK